MALVSAGAAWTFVLSEWLFFVTKPSMFSTLDWPERLGILASSAVPASVGTALGAIVLAVMVLALSSRAAAALGSLPAALVFAAVVFLLVENFTKTVFGFNIGDARGSIRYLYLAGLVVVILVVARRLMRILEAPRWIAERSLLLVAAIVGMACVIVAGVRHRPAPEVAVSPTGRDLDRANVLLLSSDGIDADRMSVYGYPRQTTPFLTSRRDEFLIAENHIANSLSTSGSTAAMLSGKLPTTTGVVRQLDVFQGQDVYQHLPGFLRQMGYFGIQVGARQYCDAYAQNLRQGFHVANKRVLYGNRAAILAGYSRFYPVESYFLALSIERVALRVRHALGLGDLHEVEAPVPFEQPSWTSDSGRIESLLRELDNAPRPFLAHVHLLDSHGPSFRPARQHFSAGRGQTKPFEVDFLDDAILGFDSYIEEVFSYLEERGELDRTIVVITSDHGTHWSIGSRVPLLIRFPGARLAGSVAAGNQTIDVAATVLEYLGMEPPDWLEGESILELEPHPPRFFLVSGKTADSIFLTHCQRWFGLDLVTGGLFEGSIQGHTAPCDQRLLLDGDRARETIVAAIQSSPHFRQPLFVGERLSALKETQDAVGRAGLVEDIVAGKVPVLDLEDGVAVVRAHWDFWTRGVQPAGVLVRNRTDGPISKRLAVHSGDRRREYPVRFFLDDGESTRDFAFTKPGRLEITLGPVAAGTDRLFIVWAERDWKPEKRALGVQLSLPPS